MSLAGPAGTTLNAEDTENFEDVSCGTLRISKGQMLTLHLDREAICRQRYAEYTAQ